ncbi:MAG: galactose-1-epimerase, partial [Flavobacteriaceae bacterium]|nr:galactose-1-epimerase [Flavobacteriaceae bacterium]
FYTGNFLNSNQPKKGGGTQLKQSGFCFETQHYPDSPNQKNFPSVILNPGEKYRSTTLFKFSIK